MLEFMIGAASFFCGFAIMFAIHRVMFDYYDDDARTDILELKKENSNLKAEIAEYKRTLNTINVEIKEVHTFATPADVADLDFLEG